jgi:hypothetical protein
MRFFSVHQADFCDESKKVLVEGYAWHEECALLLDRTGPFVPPITFPGDAVVATAAFRQAMEASGLFVNAFRPVTYHHVVEYHWNDLLSPERCPSSLPPIGDLMDYLEKQPHSPSIARQSGDLWEVVLSEGASLDDYSPLPIEVWSGTLVVHPETWNGTHLFNGLGSHSPICTEECKDWLADGAAEWVAFEELLTKRPPACDAYLVDCNGALWCNPTPEQIRRAIAEYQSASKTRWVPPVTVAYTAEWNLAIYRDGGAILRRSGERVGDLPTAKGLDNVSDEKALELAVALSCGDIQQVEHEAWTIMPPFFTIADGNRSSEG